MDLAHLVVDVATDRSEAILHGSHDVTKLEEDISDAEPVSDSYLVGVTFPAPDRVGDSEEPEFLARDIAVFFAEI
jgi:hypothetical protein